MWKEKLSKNGYVFIENYKPGYTVLDVASEVGDISLLPGVRPSQQLIPRVKTKHGPNTYSGIYGLDEFPLHTDLAHWFLPPRYLLLRCVKGSASVSTRICDSKEIIKVFGEETLSRVLVRPRRPVKCNGYLLRVFEKNIYGFSLFRWDEKFIIPASKNSKIIFQKLLDTIKKSVFDEIFLVSSGDTLLIDNWRMLHGRSSIPKEGMSRHIERVYLEGIK